MQKNKKVLLGCEAIIQGALAAGVDFVSGYPGCPSAEIGDGFGKIAEKYGVYAEWSTNEKTGLEAAIGASFSGLKSLVNMKSFGINVCADVLLPLAYTGTKAPMVIFVGDDPNCHSSAQTEQDSRGYAAISHIPFLEPSDAQECYDFTKLGFEISEKFNIPVILRTTTRVAHQRAIVEMTPLAPRLQRTKGVFVKNPHQFSTMPPRTLEMKKELLEKIEKIKAFAEKSKANPSTSLRASKKSKIGIITSGISYSHVLDALEAMNLDIPVLKLGFFYPLPEKLIANFLKGKTKILVAEELEPHIEKEIVRIAKSAGPRIEIFGKDLLPVIGELNVEKIVFALSKILKVPYGEQAIKINNSFKISNLKFKIPSRTARLCEGCPYWYIFPTLKRVAPDAIFTGDIGCNMIAGLAPHSMHDTLFAMGASIGIAHGISKATNPSSAKASAGRQKTIAMMGDGTFFHSGIAGMINSVYNQSSPLMVVLDNRITAMTGHQVNPGMGKILMGESVEELKIDEIAKACGVKHIKVLDPINIKEFEETIKDFLQKDEISLIVAKRVCELLARRSRKAKEG